MTEPFFRRAITGRIDTTHTACIGVLIALPLLLLTVNQSFVYSLAGWLDPWIYVGYHVHFASMWHFSPLAYYGTRVPYTALGAIFYRIVGAEPSLYLLVLTQFYVAMFSLYFAIRLLFNGPIAGMAAACLLGTNSWFLWAIGWKYIDGPSIACMLFSFGALAVAATGMRWRLAAVLWEVGMAATAALYLLYAVLLPVEIVAFVVFNRLAHRHPSPSCALSLCGSRRRHRPNGKHQLGARRQLRFLDIASVIDASREVRPIFLWWSDHDPALWTFQSLGIMYILNPYVPPVVVSEARVVLLASDGGLEAAEASLQEKNHMKLVSSKRKHVRCGNIDIDIAIVELEPIRQ